MFIHVFPNVRENMRNNALKACMNVFRDGMKAAVPECNQTADTVTFCAASRRKIQRSAS
jgi:hypothetical protein